MLTLEMSAGWSAENAETFWSPRPIQSILLYDISERRVGQLEERREQRDATLENRCDTFIRQNHLEHADGEPIIVTEESDDLAFWCQYQSWTYCPKCLLLEPRKLPPTFARRTPTLPHRACKCGNGTYTVPTVDDVPLVLRHVTSEEQRILSPSISIAGTTHATSMVTANALGLFV